jgi:hypothetical protein
MSDAVDLLRNGWTYERALPGGGDGATLVRRPNGTLAVLRLAAGTTLASQRERIEHIGVLRAAGYPTPAEDQPRVLADGRLALITDYVARSHQVAELTDNLLDDLLGVVELQAGLAPRCGGWGAWLNHSLADGFDDWCRPAVLQTDPRCAPLADRAIRHAAAAAAIPTTDDLIHGDLHQWNVLVRADHIVAVIDCGEVQPGDRRFDLVTALVIAADGPARLRQRLRATVEQRIPTALLKIYIAHHGVRLLDWALTHAPDQVDARVATMTEEFDRYSV